MEKLKIVDGGVLKKIEITEKLAKGIFVTAGKGVKKNCEILNIALTGSGHPNEMIQKVTKIEKVGIVSIKLQNEYYQYIFKDYAEREDVEDLIRDLPRESHEALRTAYNLTKMNTVNDVDFLGGGLGNIN